MSTKSVLIQLSGIDLETLIFDCVDRAIKLNHSTASSPPDAQADELLTPKETAQLLKVSTVTIWDWCKRGILKKHTIGNQVRYLRSEVVAEVTKRSKV